MSAVRSWRAEAGAVEAGCTPVRTSKKATTASWTRPARPPTFAPCSYGPIGRVRGLGRAILEACHDVARSEGFQRLDLGATLPGVTLYRAFGFREIEPFVVTMPDGVTIEAVAMERLIDPVRDEPNTAP